MGLSERLRKRRNVEAYEKLAEMLGFSADKLVTPDHMPSWVDVGGFFQRIGTPSMRFRYDSELYWGWDYSEKRGNFKLREQKRGDLCSVTPNQAHTVDFHTHPFPFSLGISEIKMARYLIPTTHEEDMNDVLKRSDSLAYLVLAASEYDPWCNLLLVVKTLNYSPIDSEIVKSMEKLSEANNGGELNFRDLDEFYTSMGFAIYRGHFKNDQKFPKILRKFTRRYRLPK